MKTRSLLELPLPDELSLSQDELRANACDLHALALRTFVERVNYDLAHGNRVILSANPHEPGLAYPACVMEPTPSNLNQA